MFIKACVSDAFEQYVTSGTMSPPIIMFQQAQIRKNSDSKYGDYVS